MKKLFTLIIACGLWLSASAQESMEKVMENRAREMHRVIGRPDKEQWKKFVRDNYTKALIDKPMRAEADTDSGKSGITSSTSTSSSSGTDNLEAKSAMFQRLYDDFGNSKIISIKPSGSNLEMVLKNNNGLSGTFNLKFDKNKPYLIDGLGIEVNAE